MALGRLASILADSRLARGASLSSGFVRVSRHPFPPGIQPAERRSGQKTADDGRVKKGV
jgi:hypothetical protein